MLCACTGYNPHTSTELTVKPVGVGTCNEGDAVLAGPALSLACEVDLPQTRPVHSHEQLPETACLLDFGENIVDDIVVVEVLIASSLLKHRVG